MSDNPLNSAKRFNFLEWVGIVAFILFVAGFVLYVIGSGYYVYNNWIDSGEGRFNFWLNLFLIPFLLVIPFTIQIPIFIKFLKVSKYEIVPGNENAPGSDGGLNVFFKYYCGFMCAGLFGYSLSWFFYNLNLDEWASPLWLLFSILSLIFIFLLIWILAVCTRIIIGGGKNEGLLRLADLPEDEYEKLCSRLNTILANGDVVEKSEAALRKIVEESDPNHKKEQAKIIEIVNAFSALGEITLPKTRSDEHYEEIISIIADKKDPARIKPLKRVFDFLKGQADDPVHRAIIDKKFSSISRPQLIKSLNKILINYNFYDRNYFSSGEKPTPIGEAAEYFKYLKRNDRSPHYSVERVQVENRKLFDVHILPFLKKDKGEKLNPDTIREKHSANADSALKNRKGSLLNFRLNDFKERKIVEGINQFSFSMLLFFFTIFICIVYLFAFSFAFHDRRTLKDSKNNTPALFMEQEYQSPYFNANLKPNPDSKTDSNNDKQSSFFFFYTSSESGTRYKNNRIGTDLDSQRFAANNQSLESLLKEIERAAPASKRIFVEIIGRTDDNPITKTDEMNNSKQTYSSNYDLSMARAQSLKFDLLQKLKKQPDVLEKIEWSCLPVSNDSSLKRNFPLNESTKKFSIALDEILSAEDIKQNRPNSEELKGRITNAIQNPLNAASQNPIENKEIEDELLNGRGALEQHINKSILLSDTGSIPDRNSGNLLYSNLYKELQAYLAIKEGPDANTTQEDYKKKLEEFRTISQKVDSALVFYESEKDKGNRRITEVYVTSIPYITRSNRLDLTDYILYSITTAGYGDIKPTTPYAKFLSILVNIVGIFFLVVFFNALLSVKKINEEDDAFYLPELSS